MKLWGMPLSIIYDQCDGGKVFLCMLKSDWGKTVCKNSKEQRVLTQNWANRKLVRSDALIRISQRNALGHYSASKWHKILYKLAKSNWHNMNMPMKEGCTASPGTSDVSLTVFLNPTIHIFLRVTWSVEMSHGCRCRTICNLKITKMMHDKPVTRFWQLDSYLICSLKWIGKFNQMSNQF